MKQMMDNLTQVKKVSKEWERNYQDKQQQELKEVEEGIKNLYKGNNIGIFSEEELNKLKEMEIH